MPSAVFRLPDDQLELFLGRLWSGDGFVGAAGQMPYYATSSLQLALDLQILLLRIGITSGVHTKLMRYRYKGQQREQPGYTVHVVGDASVRTFVRRLGPQLIGRTEQLAAYRTYLESIEIASSKDTIPADVRRMVNEERVRQQLGWRQLEQQSGVSMKEFVGRGSANKKGFRRPTINRLASFFESQRLREIAESDIFWDRITSIEPAGVQDTYDLTVEIDHNFVADGIVVHNSHSTAYALIAYMTAYLKAHYPVEFMAALLSGDIPGRNFKSKDALVEHLEDCQRMNIEVVPPDVNKSGVDFVVRDGRILFGLTAIKACGDGAAEAIVRARQDGPFRDLFDFCERVDPQACGRAVVETLIKAGALDPLGGNRAALMAALDRAVQAGAAIAADRRSGQKGLFDDFEDDSPDTRQSPRLPDVPEFGENERLAMEKEVLGFYISSHPLAEHEETLATFCSHTSERLGELEHRTEVLVGGMLSAIKFSHTKNPRAGSTHTKYAMWDLEDKQGIVRCILWPEPFAEYGHLVKGEAILAMRAVVDRRPGADEVNLIVQELIPLGDLAARFTSGVTIRVGEGRHGADSLARLREIIRGYPGTKPLRLWLDLADGSSVLFDCPKMSVTIDPELRRRVDDLLGPGHFRLSADKQPTVVRQPKFARHTARAPAHIATGS
jgi:DNA polymerase-3 subunit alpha